MTEARDSAGVIAPPPLIALAAVVLGLALDWLLPAYLLTVLLSLAERIVIGVVLIGGGGCAGHSRHARLPFGRHPCGALEAIQRAGDRRHLRLAAQSDVCRLGVHCRRPRHRTCFGLDAGDAGAGGAGAFISAWSSARSAISRRNSAMPTGNTRRACRVTASRPELSEISKSFRQSSICAAWALLL